MSLERLIEIMKRLRDPATGCEWDSVQTFATIAPYTIEEAYEVADAIERDDMAALRDELGDLQLQVVYHARMAEEVGDIQRTNLAVHIADGEDLNVLGMNFLSSLQRWGVEGRWLILVP